MPQLPLEPSPVHTARPKYPFEISPDELRANLNDYVDVVFGLLDSDFLVMPRGEGFVEYPIFEAGYEILKKETTGFRVFDPSTVLASVQKTPIIFIVLRTLLGFTPSELAYLAHSYTGLKVSQNSARDIDRSIRLAPSKALNCNKAKLERLSALVQTACTILAEGAPEVLPDKLHRLDKADTKYGLTGLQNLASIGVPYAMLLYERFLGRPFASHRDSVSDIIGDGLETAIEEILTQADMSFRKTKLREIIPGFDQAPDFMLPSEYNPRIVIEAKITEDDGTARDKVTRVQHLAELSRSWVAGGKPGFRVVACIGGRGFGVRREDMRKLLLATDGLVFTVRTLEFLPSALQEEWFQE